jgi:IS605 OrfB family transposase
MVTTYHFRIKDSSSKNKLSKMAGSVNFVWNYCNEVSLRSITHNSKWLSGFDLNKLTKGCSKDLGIHSQTIQGICEEYAVRRKQFKKSKLNWRSKKRSMGWIPFKASGVSVNGDEIIYQGQQFRFWKSQPIEGKIQTGSFCQDKCGRWYVNITCKSEKKSALIKTSKVVGVDLGLTTTAAYSDGTKFEGGRHYRQLEEKLGMAQRAGKKKQAKKISAKIANRRKDELHKETTRVINNYDKIFVGDVSSMKMVKTKNAKSTLDAGWGMYRSMLAYKAVRLGVEVIGTNEMFSTVTCSACSARSGSSGLSGLGVREWVCSACQAHHDRDVNAAKNILATGLGHQTLIKGITLALAG